MRPRKNGKSLFLSMLDYYYVKYKEKFERLFGQVYWDVEGHSDDSVDTGYYIFTPPSNNTGGN